MSHFGSKKSAVKLNWYENLFVGAIAGGLGVTCVHPMEVVKTRMQTIGKAKKTSIPILMKNMMKNEGIFSFTSGLSAAWARQLVYASVRLGTYPLFKALLRKEEESYLPFSKKIYAAVLSGGLGAFFATPEDLILIRMQSGKYKYSILTDGLKKTFKEGGIRELFRGSSISLLRGAVVNASSLAFYDHIKQLLINNTTYFGKDDKRTRFVSSIFAGFFCSVLSSPFDIVKTRIMSMRPNATNTLPYSGTFDCFKKIYLNEGLSTFFIGPNLRFFTKNILIILFYEKLTTANMKYFHSTEWNEWKSEDI